METVTALIVSLYAVLMPLKGWYAPDEKLLVKIDSKSAVALVIESDAAATQESLEGLADAPVDLSAATGGAEAAVSDPATAENPDDDTQAIEPDVPAEGADSDVEDDPSE